MSTVLVLTSSALGEESVSIGFAGRRLGARSQARACGSSHAIWQQPDPHINLIPQPRWGRRRPMLPRPRPRHSEPAHRRPRGRRHGRHWRADYNFGIASTLKTWFDYVLWAGMTFRYSESGREGLLKASAPSSSRAAGVCTARDRAAMDSQGAHLRTLLGFTGITDVMFVRAEKLAFVRDPRADDRRGARRLGHVFQNGSRARPSPPGGIRIDGID